MEIDADDMRIETLRIKVTSAREPFDSTPLNEQRIQIGYTYISIASKPDRDSDFKSFYYRSLSDSAITKGVEQVRENLTSPVIDITAEVRFSRQYMGSSDDGASVMLHNMTYDCKTDMISALITLEKADGTTWESAPDFKITDDEFWSVGLVDSMAKEIDRIGNSLGFATDVKSKTLKYSAFRIV